MKQNYKLGATIGLSFIFGLSSFDSYGQLYEFETHTFTNAGSIGKDGPMLSDCQTAYTAEIWELDPTLFAMSTQGIQEWTVPISGTYRIEANGAQGGDDLYVSQPEEGGLGARMIGDFDLTEGEILYILVGQRGENTRVTGIDNAASGGAGGSFVWSSIDDALPLLVAGGGAGGSGQGYANRNATDAENGHDSFSDENGGSGGNGSGLNLSGSSYWAGGGAGWLTNGTGGENTVLYDYMPLEFSAEGGRRPLEGGIGGARYNDGADEGGDGGFGGGGGGGSDNMGTGGGGGYSGGGGESGEESPDNSGGGGGSYNAGADQDNTAAINAGHGAIAVTLLCERVSVETFEDSLCIGEELTLTGTAVSGEVVTWDMGIENGVTFVPTLGPTTYTGSTIDEDDCPFVAVINVSALPEVEASVDEMEVCDGEAVTFGADGATTYTWEPAEVVEGEAYTPAVGTNTYTVTGTDENGCVSTGSIDVTVFELPAVVATVDDSEICIGDEITLTGEGATSYSWDPAEVTDGEAYTPTDIETITFTVEGTDDNGCINTAIIDVEVNNLPTVTASVDAETICQGSDVIFTGGGADTYDWDMGVTDSESFTQETEGTVTYTVVGIDANGCENTASIDVTATENTIEITGTMIPETAGDDGEIDITVMGGTPSYTFDWDTDEADDFDDDEDLTELAAGTYNVVVKDSEGCIKSEVFELVNQVGIAELDVSLIQLYPNPTNSDLTIELEGQFTYTLYNSLGSVLFVDKSVNQETLSIVDFADGVYFLQINKGGKIATLKVIKK